MFPSRYMPGQSSVIRKSSNRPADVRPSLLPKPRRPGSIDRPTGDVRRPSGSQRSSSAEPSRATLAGNRLSREASASKVPLNRRSKSQQADRHYGQSSMTPLRNTHYSRATTTPVRTPSEDRSRGWQASVEKALAFVTTRDQRPISNVAWQRAEVARVQEALEERGEGGAGIALIRPLTITRFVEITAELFRAIIGDCKLNNDNYVARLPNLAKRLLYPGAVSKSWLKTVNTLHAFPHALAFIAYFLDLANHIKLPVSDEWLYLEKDEMACLRREYLHKCWLRFQDPEYEYEDLNQEYLTQLRALLGNDEQRIGVLQSVIEASEAKLNDEAELAARAEEERLRARRDTLAAAARAVRAETRAQRADIELQRARRADNLSAQKTLDADIANTTAEIQQLKKEIETQPMTVAERARLAGEVEYATRVVDSKKTLAEQVAKMIESKEEELGEWQQRTLASCVEYKQALIHLSAQFPDLAALAVDEKELMVASCAAAVGGAVEALRAHAARLGGLRAQRARARTALARQADQQREEIKAKILEIKSTIEREQRALETELTKESTESATWAAEKRVLAKKLAALASSEEAYSSALSELDMWEKQEAAWSTRLTEMQSYIKELTEKTQRDLETEKRKRADAVKEMVRAWHRRLDEVEREERALEQAEEEKSEMPV